MHHSAKNIMMILIVLSLAGCATKGDLTVVETDLEELKGRSVRIEKDLSILRTALKEDVVKSSKDLLDEVTRLQKENAAFQESVAKDMESVRRLSADSQANLDAAKLDMKVLAGKVDDLSLQAKGPGDDLSLLREDVDRRLGAIDERLKKLELATEEFTKKAESKWKEAEQAPDVLYKRGLKLIKDGDNSQARDVFLKFIELYPNEELAPNARYWVGETYYNEKKYEQSILEFQQLIKEFPTTGKAPAALLKQGMAFRELGDPKSARYVYNKLIEDFPNVSETKQAREKLKEMK